MVYSTWKKVDFVEKDKHKQQQQKTKNSIDSKETEDDKKTYTFLSMQKISQTSN